MSSERAFPHDFNVGAFFTAMPATLKRNAKNGKSHLKILRAQGKGLQSFLETAYSLQLSHAQAMDAVARSLGFADFNEAREVLVRAPANSAKDKWSKSAALGNRWANLADVCRDGGFVIGAQGIVEHLTSSPGPVITGLNLMPRPEPEGWYTGAASRFSKKVFNGNRHFVVWAEYSNNWQDSLVNMLIDRARRLANKGLQSYLLVDKTNISDRFLCQLLSCRHEFTPIIHGCEAACTGQEGVPDGLWSNCAYDLFLSETESTSVMLDTRRPVAQALGINEEQALNLLANIPDGKFLRIPPIGTRTGQ